MGALFAFSISFSPSIVFKIASPTGKIGSHNGRFCCPLFIRRESEQSSNVFTSPPAAGCWKAVIKFCTHRNDAMFGIVFNLLLFVSLFEQLICQLMEKEELNLNCGKNIWNTSKQDPK